MVEVSRRNMIAAGGLAAGGALLLSASQAVQAQTAGSTWDQVSAAKKIRLGAAVVEPFYFKDPAGAAGPGVVVSNGVAWRGVAPLVAKEIADALGFQLEIVETTWGNSVAALQAGQFDFMFFLDPTPQRALAVSFVSSPLLWYASVLLTKDEVTGAQWSDFNDPKYKIGVVLGTSFDQYLTQNTPKADIQRFQNRGELQAAFQSGRIDAACVNGPSADLVRAAVKRGKVIVPRPIAALPAGTAVRKEADPRWREYLDVAVGYFYNVGKTQEFYEQFLAFRGLDPKAATPIIRERLFI
jgi:polar amino acid transport system substrate-binding protein